MRTLVSACLVALAMAASAHTPGLFSEQEVSVANHAAGVTLAGTVTVPAAPPAAAVVLAGGSGAQDRDEEVMGVRPFKFIADSLGAAGYGVLRMDDRGVGGSTGSADCTIDDYTSDIACALAALDSIFGPEVPKGVVGHSQGALSALRLACSDPRCRFIVTLAGPAWSGDSIIMSQARRLAVELTGSWSGEARQRQLLELVKSDMPELMLRIALVTSLGEEYGEAMNIDAVRRRVEAEAAVMAAPPYRSLVKYDPAADIAAVAVPWLALGGSLDCQVLPENLETIRELNPAATVKLLPGLNHLFQRAVTGLPAEYAGAGDPDSALTDAIIGMLSQWYPRRN